MRLAKPRLYRNRSPARFPAGPRGNGTPQRETARHSGKRWDNGGTCPNAGFISDFFSDPFSAGNGCGLQVRG